MTTATQTRRSKFHPGRLREARETTGWTQEELAEKVGASGAKTISNWECGVHTPHPRFIRQLALTLDVTVAWLRGIDTTGGS